MRSYIEVMDDNHESHIAHHVVVLAVQHDNSRVWLLNANTTEPIVEIERPHSGIIHVRGAQKRHLHSTEADEVPYFALICNEIAAASHVLVFGHGKGNSHTKKKFLDFVQGQNPDISKMCVDAGTIDFASHTNGQIVALAKSVWSRV